MSPRNFVEPARAAVGDAVQRFWVTCGMQLRDARLARRWPVPELARRAGVSRAVGYAVEAGRPTSIEAVVRVSAALGLRLDVELTDPRRALDTRPSLRVDAVHSAMGEFEAGHLRTLGHPVGIDEPYQHYQFAGRADVVAWDAQRKALLHIENRTRFPDLQAAAGSYNAKRAYLAISLGARLGVTRWDSQTHVVAALWSSDVVHALRLRTESFRALCPDGPAAFAAWWTADAPDAGLTSTLILLDPLARGRQRTFVGLDAALATRPRYRDYAHCARRLMADRG